MFRSFQARFFLAALASTVIALAVAGAMSATAMRRQIDRRIEATLMAEARLAAELLARAAPVHSMADLDEEADRIGQLIDASVTFIGPSGRVLGDSAETPEGVAAMENHADRPEVIDARARGIGRSQRRSTTLGIDMLYIAVPIPHRDIAVVRVALPLTDVRHQLEPVLTATLTALAFALVGGAGIAWFLSARIGKRVRSVADLARRYAAGDLTPSRLQFGDDELGAVARTLDSAMQEVARKLAEQARDRAHTESILAGMIEGVIVVDGQGRLHLANDAARRLLKLDDVGVGRPYIETIRHPAIAELVAATLRGRSTEALQLTPPRDPSKTIMASAAPAAGDPVHGVIVVLHDITELRRADQIRRDFVANVSHELRTPLTAIRGYVEALSEGDVTPEDSRRFLDVISRHTLRMDRLIKDLLRLARLDGGQETLDVASCDARALVRGVLTELGSSIDAHHQRIDVAIGADADTIRGDPAKLHDALRNLIANAVNYAPEGTTIRVETARAGDRMTIAVSDDGPGIPEEDLTLVFERFYRVDKSRGRDPGGTGLGLAIVKHLVGLHGGDVRAEQRPGGGARFVITLPT